MERTPVQMSFTIGKCIESYFEDTVVPLLPSYFLDFFGHFYREEENDYRQDLNPGGCVQE